MYIVIFSYDREEMLRSLLSDRSIKKFETLIIDDGSEYSKENLYGLKIDRDRPLAFMRTKHEGKRGFWKKWLIAQQIALGTNEEYFLFLPDDFKGINFKEIEKITEQGWEDNYFALNISNEGELYRWGKHRTGQTSITIGETKFRECCYVDGAFITNRKTLSAIDIDPVPSYWFDRADKSSGVGYQMTMKLREIGCPMMRPIESLAYHGEHESKMHPEHRKANPLITK